MTRSGARTTAAASSFEERLGILAEELELSIKWQRPCMVLVVYSSEYVRADVEVALENRLFDLGQRSVRLSVKSRDPQAPAPFFKEFREPSRSVYFIDGFRWGGGCADGVYSTACLQREYFAEKQIRSVFWVTPNEINNLARAVPDLWVYRQRVIEFVDAPKAERVMKQSLDTGWQGGGEIAAELEDTDAKISMRESMLTELPNGEEASSIRGNLLLTLGVLNWRKGDFEQAEEQLREALTVATKIQDNWFEAECFNAVALVKSSTGRIDEAIEAYKQALVLAPNQIFVWNNLGNLCVKAGRNDEAMIAFRKALECNARDAIALTGLAGVHFRLGYADDAIAAYRQALQFTPTFAQPWCGLGDVYAAGGKADEALQCYHKAIELNKKSAAPWLRMGELFCKQERFREAVRALQKAVALDSQNTQAWTELGNAQARAETFEDAAASYLKAVELDRGNGWAYSNLAHAYMQLGRNKEAVSLLLRSIDLLEKDTDKAVSWNRLADVYRALNDYHNAMAAYQTADRLKAGGETGKRKTASALEAPPSRASMDEPDEISQAVTPPKSAPDIQVESEIVENESTRGGAEEAPAWIFRRPAEDGVDVVAGGTSEPAIHAEKGEAQVTQSSISEGGQIQGAQPAAKGKYAPEAMRLTAEGNSHFKAGALDAAVAAYNKAIQIDDSYAVPYSNLALTYVTQGQFVEAILLYQRSVELLQSDRDKALSWNGLGNAYRCIGDYANAVAAYQQAAHLDPETSGIRDQADSYQPPATQRSAAGWNSMGELLLRTGALDKAIEAFSKAIELEAGFGRAHFNLARAHAAEGKHAEAVPHYEKSIQTLEEDRAKAEAWNGLGNAYRKLNDYDRAIEAYQKAVVLADEGTDLLSRTRFSLMSNVFAHQNGQA